MRKILISLVASQIAANAYAYNGMGRIVIEQPPAGQTVYSISVGPIWQQTAQSQTLALTPNIVKTYAPDNSSQGTMGYGEFFYGIQEALSQTTKWQLGLALAQASKAGVAGEIWDDADPRFNNLTFVYEIRHTNLAIKGKLLADPGFWVLPWINASIGVGFNKAFAFDNQPRICEVLVNPNFGSHTLTSFSYTLGIGAERALTDNWHLGFGFEFANWGKAFLGRAFEQTTSSGPGQNHIYTNGLLFNLTYLA